MAKVVRLLKTKSKIYRVRPLHLVSAFPQSPYHPHLTLSVANAWGLAERGNPSRIQNGPSQQQHVSGKSFAAPDVQQSLKEGNDIAADRT